MLTQRHLAIIRAALQFFDDEMVPHGMRVIRPYLDANLHRSVTSTEIQHLRSFLRNVTLKYGRFDHQTGQMVKTTLRSTAQKRKGVNSPDSHPFVVVLISSGH